MKRGVKIALIVLGGVMGLLVLLAVLLPLFFKPQLLRLAQREIGRHVEADVTIGDLNVSLIKAFPRLYVGLEDVAVLTRAPFAGDTLAAFDRFGLAVNVKTLFNPSRIEVYGIDLQRLRAYAHKDTLGRVNWDVFPKRDSAVVETDSTGDEQGSALGISLRRLTLSRALLSYRDDSARIFAEARDLDFTLRGDLGAKRSTLGLLLTIAKTTLKMGAGVMVPGVSVSLGASVDADLERRFYRLGENELRINEFGLKFGGEISMPGDSIVPDLRFETSRTDFKTLLSLVPAMYKKGLADVQTSGALQVGGEIKGVLHGKELPSAKLNLQVLRANFKYPSLPKSVDNIGIALDVDFDGKVMDRTRIDLNRFHAEMAGNPVDLEAHVRTPLSDPNVRASVVGKVKLDALHEVLPLDDLTLRGLLDLSVRMAASRSQVERKQYESCELEGYVRLTDAVVKGVLPVEVQVPTLGMSLSTQRIRVEELRLRAGRTDASLEGGLYDFLPYLMAQGVVTGDLKLRSNRVDLNELFPSAKGEGEKSPGKDTAASRPTDLSAARRVVFDFDSQIDSLYFQQLRASDVRGRFALQRGKLTLKEIGARALGGSMNVSGDFDFSNEVQYGGTVRAALEEVSVQESVRTFSSVEKLLSAARYMRGNVSLDVDATTNLATDFSPELKSLQASGTLRTSVLSLEGVPAFEKLGAMLGNDYISKPALKKVKIPFRIEDGNVIFSPFEFSVNGVKGTMGGKVGLDQTVDYDIAMSVPRGALGKGAEVLGQLESNLPKGVSLGAEIPIGVRVSGPAKAPKVELTVAKDFANQLRGYAEQKVQEIKSQVESKVQEAKVEAQKQIDASLAQAEAEAAKIRAQAKEQTERLLEEAQAKADALVAEAATKGALAGFAAKKAADKLMEEARSRANGILSEADRKAEAVVREAKSKSQL